MLRIRIILVLVLFLLSSYPGRIESSAAVWQFSDVAHSAGIDVTVLAGTREKKYLAEMMTGGVCSFDFDNDGWADVFVVNGTTREFWNTGKGPSNRLFRNNHDGSFADVTDKAGLSSSAWGMGCVAGDYDNDGNADLYVTNYGPNFLYHNNGDGTFREVGKAAGVDDPSWGTGAAFGDYDNDGYLDLYVANYVQFDFARPSGEPKLCSYRGVPVACGPMGLPGAPDVLYHNNRDGTFTNVTRSAGIDDSEGLYGFQPMWTDVDLDGYLDIFVANDSTPNFLWHNNRNGTFSDIALTSGVAYNQDGRAQANMGVDVGDYDGDGYQDIYSTTFSDDYYVLYRNSGKSYFLDASYEAKVALPTMRYLGFGCLFSDLDNDGWQDLFVVNGHIYPEVDNFHLGTEYNQRNQIFRNLGNGTFAEVGPKLGPSLAVAKPHRGAVVLDYDHDGDLDVVVTSMDEKVELLRNDLPRGSNFLEIVLLGHKSNRDAAGARAIVSSRGRKQTQELHVGAGYLSSNEKMLHFGIGLSKAVDSLEVIWPSGKRQKFPNVPVNKRILVDEDKGIVP